MKKILKSTAVIGLVSLSLMASYVFAENDKTNETKHEDNKQQMEITREDNKQSAEIKRESDKNKQEINKSNEDADNDGMNDQEESDNEVSLHEHFSQIPSIKTVITVPEIDSTKINTYADAVVVLNQYTDVVNQIKNQESTIISASSTLSTQEKLILSKITSKHNFELSRTNVRADELLAQIKDLTDILTPLGTQTISADFNLKNLLISQLNDFNSSIKSLLDLGDNTSSILNEETN